MKWLVAIALLLIPATGYAAAEKKAAAPAKHPQCKVAVDDRHKVHQADYYGCWKAKK